MIASGPTDVPPPAPAAEQSPAPRPAALEVCCGHAGLTAALHERGFDARGIDWKGNKHRVRVPIVIADITTEAGQIMVRGMVERGHVRFVRMAPPCGTCSRARDKRVPAHLAALGAPDPPPLRDEQRPEGLPNLSRTNQIKVDKANIIANFCAELAQLCLDAGTGFSIESPERSYLWMLPHMKKVVCHDRTFTVSFDHCMWGGRRENSTSFLTNVKQLRSLEKRCGNAHEHLPWSATKQRQG